MVNVLLLQTARFDAGVVVLPAKGVVIYGGPLVLSKLITVMVGALVGAEAEHQPVVGLWVEVYIKSIGFVEACLQSGAVGFVFF